MRKRIMLSVLAIGVMSSSIVYAEGFKDTKNHWAEGYINLMKTHNISSGYEDGTFKPENDITVAEYVSMTLKARGIDYDKVDGYWYEGVIQKALEEGIIQQGEFKDYNKSITRGEMARIAVRSLKVDVEEGNTEFTDDNLIPSSLKPYIREASNSGLLKGNPDGTFRADNKLTRSEASTVIIKTSTISSSEIKEELNRVKENNKKEEDTKKEDIKKEDTKKEGTKKEGTKKEEQKVENTWSYPVPELYELQREGRTSFSIRVRNIEDYKDGELRALVECLNYEDLNKVLREENGMSWYVDSREWWRKVGTLGNFFASGKSEHHDPSIWKEGNILKFKLTFKYKGEETTLYKDVKVQY